MPWQQGITNTCVHMHFDLSFALKNTFFAFIPYHDTCVCVCPGAMATWKPVVQVAGCCQGDAWQDSVWSCKCAKCWRGKTQGSSDNEPCENSKFDWTRATTTLSLSGVRVLTLYRRIFQLLEGSSLAFALKEQYLNNYKRYPTTLDTPLERSSHCASNDEKYYERPFQTPKIHSPEWRKSPSENWNRKSNRSSSVEQLWSSFFRQSTAWILAVICCIHF